LVNAGDPGTEALGAAHWHGPLQLVAASINRALIP
jgi:hypothetical protein